MIRRQALEAAAHPDGIFSSDYFLYGEDMDLCRRIARASWDIVYSPSAAIVHYEGQSLTQQTLEIQGSKLRGLRTVFQADHGRFAVLLFDLISAAGFGLRYTLNRLGAVVMPGRGFSAQAELSRQRLAETLRPLTRGRRTTP
jgi:GT2 family glycosyltransferase